MSENKKRAQSTVDKLRKALGSEVAMMLDDKPNYNGDVIPTGSIDLDLALGVGGFPKGRVVEIYGPESSGKTTLTIHAMAECQKKGGVVGFIDAEHAFDKQYAEALGVDTSEVIFSQPDNGEQALEAAEIMARDGVDLVIIDSVAALVPKSEIEGNMGDSQMGVQARLMSQALRKLTPVVGNNDCTMIFINQIRMKIGVMFGNPETTSGGNALKFFASIRLDIRKSGSATKDSEGRAIKQHTKVKVVKNKLAPPLTIAEFDIEYGKGIDNYGSVLQKAVDYNIVKKSGSWYAYQEDKIGQGKEKTIMFLKDNQEIYEDILDKVLNPDDLNIEKTIQEVPDFSNNLEK